MKGLQYRPSHIHVKIRATGFAALTTQLYFPTSTSSSANPSGETRSSSCRALG